MKSGIVASNGLIDIKDYIHLYIGCNVSREHKAERSEKFSEYGKLVGISASEVEPGRIVAIIDVGLDHQHEWYVEETILNLRPLSSMTEEEVTEMYNDLYDTAEYPETSTRYKRNFVRLKLANWEPEAMRYLLSKGFDLFNLIENNLAISSHA